MPVPPKIVRRLLLAPAVVLLEALVLAVSPVLLLLALLVSPFFGGWRPVRLLLLTLVATLRHLCAILACLALWFASGFGWKVRSDTMQRAHYAVMRWFVAGIYRAIVRLARVEVTVSASAPAEAVLSTPGRPVVVLSRHAGEGETLLVIHELLCRHARGPRVVLHERLRLDPLIDVLGDRLPNRFVDPRGGDTEVEIAGMARELGGTAALVIFPEGVNFSQSSRLRGIERLERAGHAEKADWARRMRHVSPPRPGGTLAAIEATPEADVVVMGHVGFPTGFSEVWSLLPERQTIEVRLWHEPAAAIPSARDDQLDWLYGWWQTLDAWVDERERERASRRGGDTMLGESLAQPPSPTQAGSRRPL